MQPTRTGWKGGRFPELTDALTKMMSMGTEPTKRGMITHLSRDPDRAMRVTTITVGAWCVHIMGAVRSSVGTGE